MALQTLQGQKCHIPDVWLEPPACDVRGVWLVCPLHPTGGAQQDGERKEETGFGARLQADPSEPHRGVCDMASRVKSNKLLPITVTGWFEGEG